MAARPLGTHGRRRGVCRELRHEGRPRDAARPAHRRGARSHRSLARARLRPVALARVEAVAGAPRHGARAGRTARRSGVPARARPEGSARRTSRCARTRSDRCGVGCRRPRTAGACRISPADRRPRHVAGSRGPTDDPHGCTGARGDRGSSWHGGRRRVVACDQRSCAHGFLRERRDVALGRGQLAATSEGGTQAGRRGCRRAGRRGGARARSRSDSRPDSCRARCCCRCSSRLAAVATDDRPAREQVPADAQPVAVVGARCVCRVTWCRSAGVGGVRSARPGRTHGAIDPGVGKRPLPQAAQSVASLHGRSPPRRNRHRSRRTNTSCCATGPVVAGLACSTTSAREATATIRSPVLHSCPGSRRGSA